MSELPGPSFEELNLPLIETEQVEITERTEPAGTKIVASWETADGRQINAAVIEQESVTLIDSETGEIDQFQFRFATEAELADYREASIADGAPYHIAVGSLVIGTEDKIGYISAIEGTFIKVNRRRKGPFATITYGDGSTEKRETYTLRFLADRKSDDPIYQTIPENYRSNIEFQSGKRTIRLGDRVVVDGHFVGAVRAIWPQQDRPPLVAVLSYERHYFPKDGDYALKAGEQIIFIRVTGDRLVPAPEPSVFTSRLRILDEE